METQNTLKVVGKIDLSKFEKKQPEKIIYPTEVIHFFKDKSKKIIGRAESGKIAIISYDYKGQWINEGEDWLCEIIEEQDKKVIVMPIELKITADENFKNSLESLKNFDGFEIRPQHSKNTRFYYSTKTGFFQ